MIKRKTVALAIAAAVAATSPLAGLCEPAAQVLNELPSSATWSLSPMFMANALGQTGLNGQRDTTPETLLNQLRESLEKAGYSEQPIRTTIGAWGFSATWTSPDAIAIDGTTSGKEAVLVTQATAIGPSKVNLNIRFAEVAPIKSGPQQESELKQEKKEKTKPSTNINIKVPSPRRFF